MDPKKWGSTFWWFLQWLANKVDATIHSTQQLSDRNIQSRLLKRFTQFVELFGTELIPCRSCQDSTKLFLKHLPGKTVVRYFQSTGVSTASLWIYQLHNLVNTKLNKSQMTAEEFKHFETSNEFQEFPIANLQYIESCILYCLQKWPQRKRRFVAIFSEFLSPILFELSVNGQFANMSSRQSTDLLHYAKRYSNIVLK